MNSVLLFFIAFLISAVGTLPPGLITLTITQTTIKEGRRAGLQSALGATIPEFIYTYLALIGADFLLRNADISYYIQLASAILFFGLGIWFWLISPKSQKTTNTEVIPSRRFFQRGLAAGFFNFLIIPFWLFIIVWLRANGYVITKQAEFLLFATAGALGALCAFLLYLEIGGFILRKFRSVERHLNKAIGSIFLLLCAFQVWEVIG
ncbi:MAG: LysE family transporter [Bacteroidota bacterium]